MAAASISEDEGATWRELERFSPHPDHTVNHIWFNHVLRGKPLDGSRCRIKIEISGGGIEQVIANSVVKANPAWPSELRLDTPMSWPCGLAIETSWPSSKKEATDRSRLVRGGPVSGVI